MRVASRVLTGSAAAACAAVMSVAAAGPVHAGQDAEACTKAAGSYVDCAGHMKFRAYGEHFYLSDRSNDGAGVYLEVVAGNAIRPIMSNSIGAGTTTHYDESYSEGVVITYRLCLRNNGTILTSTCTTGQAVA